MSAERKPFFEAVLLRVHARMRLRPPYPLSARDVDGWLARRDPALLDEAERETERWITILRRLADLGAALTAADQRRLAHWCHAWGFALDPVLAAEAEGQQQVRANLAMTGMLHPTLADALREDNLEQLVRRLLVELVIAPLGGQDRSRVQAALARFVQAAGLPPASARPPKLARSELLQALSPLVWPFTLQRAELVGPVTAFRLALFGTPDAEIYPWLPETEPCPWVWTGDAGALASWLRRRTAARLQPSVALRAALTRLDEQAGGARGCADECDLQLLVDLSRALTALAGALTDAGLSREEALVSAFLAHLDGDAAGADRQAMRGGLLPGAETAWIRASNLPELLARISLVRHHPGPAGALRAAEQLAGQRRRAVRSRA